MTSFPACESTASPNAVVLPSRTTDVLIVAGRGVPGRRKKPETTIGSGNGTLSPSARVQWPSGNRRSGRR